jgi:hypothetical protein
MVERRMETSMSFFAPRAGRCPPRVLALLAALAMLLVADRAGAVDYGWEPIAGGGIQYIIQIRPEMVDAMRQGDVLESELPEIPGGIRRYRIVFGNEPLPHHGEPLPTPEPAASPAIPTASIAPPTATQPALPTGTPAFPFEPSAPSTNSAWPFLPTTPQNTSSAAPVIPATPTTIPALTISPPATTLSEPRAFTPPPTNDVHVRPAVGEVSPPRDSTPAVQIEPSSPSDRSPTAEQPKPWAPLVAALIGLFTSLGGNVYLGWIAADLHRRCRQLLGSRQ